MSHVEVRDHALWAKHIHGNEPLKEKILSLSQGQLVELIVDGLKALGDSRQYWHALNDHRGTVVQIKEA